MFEKKTIVTLFSILFLLNVIGGVFIFTQQRKLNTLGALYDKNNVDFGELGKADLPDAIKEKIKDLQFQNVTNGETLISGKVVSINGNTITISAQMQKFDELKDKDLTKPYTLETEEKQFQVNIVDSTHIDRAQLSSLRAGDFITASFESSIYNKTTAIAKSIVVIPVIKESALRDLSRFPRTKK